MMNVIGMALKLLAHLILVLLFSFYHVATFAAAAAIIVVLNDMHCTLFLSSLPYCIKDCWFFI